MMVYRSVVLGLLGAIAMLVATRPATPARPRAVTHISAPCAALLPHGEPPRGDAVVDVAKSAVSFDDAYNLLDIGPGDRITMIDDRPVPQGPIMQFLFAFKHTEPGGHLDLQIDGPGGSRRVLVLVHP